MALLRGLDAWRLGRVHDTSYGDGDGVELGRCAELQRSSHTRQASPPAPCADTAACFALRSARRSGGPRTTARVGARAASPAEAEATRSAAAYQAEAAGAAAASLAAAAAVAAGAAAAGAAAAGAAAAAASLQAAAALEGAAASLAAAAVAVSRAREGSGRAPAACPRAAASASLAAARGGGSCALSASSMVLPAISRPLHVPHIPCNICSNKKGVVKQGTASRVPRGRRPYHSRYMWVLQRSAGLAFTVHGHTAFTAHEHTENSTSGPTQQSQGDDRQACRCREQFVTPGGSARSRRRSAVGALLRSSCWHAAACSEAVCGQQVVHRLHHLAAPQVQAGVRHLWDVWSVRIQLASATGAIAPNQPGAPYKVAPHRPAVSAQPSQSVTRPRRGLPWRPAGATPRCAAPAPALRRGGEWEEGRGAVAASWREARAGGQQALMHAGIRSRPRAAQSSPPCTPAIRAGALNLAQPSTRSSPCSCCTSIEPAERHAVGCGKALGAAQGVEGVGRQGRGGGCLPAAARNSAPSHQLQLELCTR